MSLSNILYHIAFCTGFLGMSGLCGAIQFGTGYVSSIALLGICFLSSIWGRYEDGYLSKHKKGRSK